MPDKWYAWYSPTQARHGTHIWARPDGELVEVSEVTVGSIPTHRDATSMGTVERWEATGRSGYPEA